MMKRIILPLMLLLTVTATAHARKLPPRYDNFRNIARASSTNRFESSVYIAGWVKSGAVVLQWTETLTLNKLLAACGGKKVRKDDVPSEWIYAASVFRATEADPNPKKPFVTIVFHPDDTGLAQTKLEPEDAVLVTRQKKMKPNNRLQAIGDKSPQPDP